MTRLITAAEALAGAASHANMVGAGTGVTIPGNPSFSYINCDAYRLGHFLDPGNAHTRDLPNIMPWQDWDGVQSIVAFLNANDSAATWAYPSAPELAWGYAYRPAYFNDSPSGEYRCNVPDWLLPYVSGFAYDKARQRRTPPVWPGLSQVTLSTPVALDTGLTITEQMDGVIVTITDAPARLGSYDFDGIRVYANAGRVAFVDDNGSYEFQQLFGFPQHILCPKSMTFAAGCVVATTSGIVGTITPWLSIYR